MNKDLDKDLNKSLDILGVRVDNLSRKEVLEKVNFFLGEPFFHQIVTVNPEFVLEAQKNPPFKNILNSGDLNVADGVGLHLAFWKKGQNLRCRLTGADLLGEILRLAERKKMSIFLAINKNGLSSWEEIRQAIFKIYPKLDIAGDNIDPSESDYKRLNTDAPILFCNFGAPHQEIFINLQKSDKIRLAMGVGGAFDFMTGKIRRAPKFMQKMGLEWLWRMFQPQEWKYKKKRLKRLWKAVIVFPIKVILNK